MPDEQIRHADNDQDKQADVSRKGFGAHIAFCGVAHNQAIAEIENGDRDRYPDKAHPALQKAHYIVVVNHADK